MALCCCLMFLVCKMGLGREAPTKGAQKPSIKRSVQHICLELAHNKCEVPVLSKRASGWVGSNKVVVTVALNERSSVTHAP